MKALLCCSDCRCEAFNVTDLAENDWTAYRFEVVTEKIDYPDVITHEIDGQLIELCAEATVKAGPLS